MKKEKTWIIDLCASLLLTVAVALMVRVLFGHVLAGNDDLLLRSIANGTYTGTPEAHLIYIMYPLGLIFKLFYSITRAFSWYDFFMLLFHYSAWCLILFKVLSLMQGAIRKVIAAAFTLGLLFATDLAYISLQQYTLLAGVLAAVAIIYVAGAGIGESNRIEGIDFVVPVVFLTLTLWLRKQVFLMALPIVGIALLFVIFNAEKRSDRKNRFKGCLAFVGVILIAGFLSYLADTVAYSNDEWKAFTQYNEARTDVYDFRGFPQDESNYKVYDMLGLNDGDVAVMKDFCDPGLVDNLDTYALSQIARVSAAEQETLEQYYNVPRKILYDLCDNILFNGVQPMGIILLVFVALTFFTAWLARARVTFLVAATVSAYHLLFTGYFVYKGRFPERVSFGLMFMETALLAMVLIVTLGRFELKKSHNISLQSLAEAVVFTFLFALFMIYRSRITLDRITDYKVKAYVWADLNNYCKAHGDSVYYFNTYSTADLVDFMFDDASSVADNAVLPGNWALNSPLDAKHLGRLEISKLSDALLNNADVFYIVKEEYGCEWLDSFYRSRNIKATAGVTDTITACDGVRYSVIEVRRK